MIPDRVLIVGGGLAGPALALALAKRSVKSIILERNAEIVTRGGVIMLAPNAMRVMNMIGIGDALRAKGYSFDAIHVHVQSSSSLPRAGGFTQTHQGTRALSIARPVLQQCLFDVCERYSDLIEIRYDAKLQSIKETSSDVTAVLENGDCVSGSILVGADGIGSKTREYILGKDAPKPEFSGLVMIGGIVPSSSVVQPDGFEFPAFLYTQKGAFLSFAMDDSAKEVQWVTSVPIAERDRKTGWEEYRRSGEALRALQDQFAGMEMQPLRSLVDGLTTDNVQIWAPYQVPDLKTWHTERVVLVADAAHAVPPSGGQGFAQACEDIGLLARVLTSSSSPLSSSANSPSLGSSPSASPSASTSDISPSSSHSSSRSASASPSATPSSASHSSPTISASYGPLFERFERKRRQRVDMIRKFTANAESSRRETSSAALWQLKSWSTRSALWLFGKNGYLHNTGITGYDVTQEVM